MTKILTSPLISADITQTITVSGEERKILVFSSDELWSHIVQRLTWVAQFMTEVQEQPFLQHLDKEELEYQFHRFIAESAKLDDFVGE